MTAILAKPDRPVFTIDFHDEVRTGRKDSSEWAAIVNPNAVVVAGALVGNAVPANTPFINPNVLTMDEHHQILEAGMVAKIGKVSETLKATLDTTNNDDSRDYVKYPASNVIADPTVVVHDDQESRVSTSFRLLNQAELKFNEHVALEVGLTYLHTTLKNGGNWITPAYNATAKTVFVASTAAAIYGGAKVDDYVGNIFLKLTPNKNWLVDLGFRDESSVISDHGGFTLTSVVSGSTTINPNTITTANDVTYSHQTDHMATPEVSVQFLGIDRLSLYGTFDSRSTSGKQHWINPYAANSTTAGVTTFPTAPTSSVFFQDANQDYDDAKFGANWNASSRVTARAEIFRKDHQNKFIGSSDYAGIGSSGAFWMTNYVFTGLKLSVTFRPAPEWSLSTRYQPQRGNFETTGNAVNGGVGTAVASGKVRTQMISESVNWTPSGRIYLQANLNVVYNYIQTAYPLVVVSATTYIPSPIQNSNNNYVSGSALCGFVLNKETDAQLQGAWQQATNFNPQIAAGGQPYGSSYLEESVTGGLTHKFSNRLMGEGKVGYLRRTDATTGGFTNYRGPLAYVALTYSL